MHIGWSFIGHHILVTFMYFIQTCDENLQNMVFEDTDIPTHSKPYHILQGSLVYRTVRGRIAPYGFCKDSEDHRKFVDTKLKSP